MRSVFISILCFAGISLLAWSPVQAQDDAAARAAAEKARETAELRIEADMIKMNNLVEALSRNLGQMHYLRTLCFGSADQKWRNYASRMMTIESGDNNLTRRSLVQAFNEGYYLEEGRHGECSTKVSVDAAALAENGRHIASMLGDPYREDNN